MKKHLMTLAAAMMALASCSQKEVVPTIVDDGPDTFYAYSQEAAPGAESRTIYTNRMYWTPDDELSIFTGSDANKRFVLADGAYELYARFTRADNDFYSAKSALDANYAVYPYNHETDITADGVVYYPFPYDQAYATLNGRLGTFSEGALPMIAVTENRTDQDLFFKNLGGVLVFNLTGTDRIRKIVVEGNNNEAMNGYMMITSGPTRSSEPTIEMNTQNPTPRQNSIVLWVTEEDQGYLDPETATEFWVVVPPITFEKGITVTFFNELGQYMTKTLNEELIINRNGVLPMGTLAFAPEGGLPFDDPAFADWCASFLDTDGDWILSDEEVAAVRQLRVYSDKIRSLKGIEAFPNLTYLLYDGYTVENELGESYATGLLTGVDISSNLKLDTLIIRNSQLFQTFVGNNHPQLSYLGIIGSMRMTALDVSGCTNLKRLYCYDNQWLETLNIENTPNLALISASRTRINNLTTGTGLQTIFIDNANLSNVDLSASENLSRLYAQYYQGTSLDLSHNPKLTNLDLFSSDKLESLDLSANPLLYELNCEQCYNLTGMLDLSNHRWLDNLQLRGSGITNLALTSQPIRFLIPDGLTYGFIAPPTPGLVDLGLPSGLKWATCNLGADDPIQAGYFYRWAYTQPAKQDESSYQYFKYVIDEAGAANHGTPVDGIKILEAADDAATYHLGAGWRTPTYAEAKELVQGCDWTWTSQYAPNGLFLEDGYLGTSKTNGATIFLPAVGHYRDARVPDGAFYLWTSELNTTNVGIVYAGDEETPPVFLVFTRTAAMPIRPVHD